MKKVLFILLGILCAVSVFAVSYATPYKGSGRSGEIYLSNAAHRSVATMSMAQAPVATMSSTSSINTGVRGVNVTRTMTVAMPATNSVRGIYTAASAVAGGVTTYETGAPHKGHIRRAGSDTPPEPGPGDDGYCEHCHYVWDQSLNKGYGGWICDRCGCELMDGCKCGYCWCPLDLNWSAMVLMAVMAAAYVVWKKRTA